MHRVLDIVFLVLHQLYIFKPTNDQNTRHYRIQFVDRNERKRMMNNHRQKLGTIKQWSQLQQRKNYFLRKKQARVMKNKQEIQEKLSQK